MTRLPPLRAGRRRAAACVLALLAVGPPTPGAAQSRAARLTVDNDVFNFWIPFDRRPDYEYTHGHTLSAEWAGGPVWARRLAPRAVPCNGAEPAETACVSTAFEFGQKMFTPRREAPTPVPGERPFAGWMFVAATGQLSTAKMRRAVGAELGITGPPSQAEAAQKRFHDIFDFREPQGWEHQVRFRPGLTVRYDEAVLLGELRAGGGRVLALAPEWGARAGTVRTAAHVGVRAVAGLRAPHPWSAAADRDSGPLSVYVVAAARQEAVARDLFLDGSAAGGGGPGVEPRLLVFRRELGAGVRWRDVSLEYRAATRSREYDTEPRGHTYGTFVLAWRAR